MNDPRTLVAMVSDMTIIIQQFYRFFILLGLGQPLSVRSYPSLSSDSTGWDYFRGLSRT